MKKNVTSNEKYVTIIKLSVTLFFQGTKALIKFATTKEVSKNRHAERGFSVSKKRYNYPILKQRRMIYYIIKDVPKGKLEISI